MEEINRKHSVPEHSGRKGRPSKAGSRGAALFCLAMCFALLFTAALSSPLSQSSALAKMDNGLRGLHGAPKAEAAEETAAPDFETLLKEVDPCWYPLLERLKTDDMFGADVAHWFAGLPDPYSEKPMGVKVTTLFKRKFILPYFPYFNKPVKAAEIYDGVVTKGNIQKCYEFLSKHGAIFQKAEDKYFVPKEVLVSLLMVETRLGNFIGSEHAFWSLACMASAEKPDNIGSYLSRLPVTEAHGQWLDDILKARSKWAYTELKALILYCRQHEHDPLAITGSIYGAIGLCQFMPSNISFYAVDGNGDGKIDLFSLEDAVPSAANFLKTHGWRQNTTGEKRVKMLKYYNHSTAYANTIMGLADGVKVFKPSPAKATASTTGKAKTAANTSKSKTNSAANASKPAAKTKNATPAKKS